MNVIDELGEVDPVYRQSLKDGLSIKTVNRFETFF